MKTTRVSSSEYLEDRGWVLKSGQGPHSYWERPRSHRQRKLGKIYIRSVAVQIQRTVDQEEGISCAREKQPFDHADEHL